MSDDDTFNIVFEKTASGQMSSGPIDLDVLAGRKVRRPTGCIAWVLGIVVLVAVSGAFTAALGAIWPGVYKQTAPIVCPAGYDDPLIVRDSSQIRPGETSTTFTMYCMNERGEVDDVGTLVPSLLIFAAVTVVAIVAMLLIVGLVRLLRRRRTPSSRPGLIS